MIVNIIDHRKRKFRFYKINVVVEAAWHDNSCKDSDQITDRRRGPDYSEREHVSYKDAIEWGNSFEAPVTLYIYDQDDGIYVTQTKAISGTGSA